MANHAMGNHVPYGEGDVFAVPLDNGEFALGLAARVNSEGVVVGYFFSHRYDRSPTAEDLAHLKSDSTILVKAFGDLGLLRGTWPVIGLMPSWRREEWPMPAFGRAEPITGRLLRVEYQHDDPNSTPREEEVSRAEFEALPEDGLAGVEFMQKRLSRLLTT